MKKPFLLIFAIFLVFSLLITACGKKNPEPSPTPEEPSSFTPEDTETNGVSVEEQEPDEPEDEQPEEQPVEDNSRAIETVEQKEELLKSLTQEQKLNIKLANMQAYNAKSCMMDVFFNNGFLNFNGKKGLKSDVSEIIYLIKDSGVDSEFEVSGINPDNWTSETDIEEIKKLIQEEFNSFIGIASLEDCAFILILNNYDKIFAFENDFYAYIPNYKTTGITLSDLVKKRDNGRDEGYILTNIYSGIDMVKGKHIIGAFPERVYD